MRPFIVNAGAGYLSALSDVKQPAGPSVHYERSHLLACVYYVAGHDLFTLVLAFTSSLENLTLYGITLAYIHLGYIQLSNKLNITSKFSARFSRKFV